jgi:hypothetical protein
VDDNKKPGGARDISDLKARLGLKKTGTMPTVSPTGEPAAPAPAPGMPATPASVPSPFGQPAPVAAQPAPPPDPRRDPFAQQQAANLAAFYGINQQLPGSVDGSTGEPMTKAKPWGFIAAVGIGGLVVFMVGSFWGGISRSRVEYNESTDHAALIRDQVTAMQRNLESILAELRKSTVNGKIDLGQADRLASVVTSIKKPDSNLLFRTDYSNLEGLGIDRLFTYYNDTIKLYEAIEQHARKTNADKEALQKFLDAAATASQKNYGFIIDSSGPLALAKFVEVGSPMCPKEGQVECDPKTELKGFRYRLESSGTWSEKGIHGKNPIDSIYPLNRTPLFNSVAIGSTTPLDDYNRRVKNIVELVADLEKTQKELAPDIKKTADRPHVFTF